MKKITTAALVLIISLSGCQKDIDQPNNTRDTLMEGVWSNAQYGQDMNNNLKPDDGEFWAMEPCASDDVYRFVANGILKLSNGEQKCYPGDPLEETYLWNLSKDKQTLSISYAAAGPTINYKIISITKDALVLGNYVSSGYYFTKYSR